MLKIKCQKIFLLILVIPIFILSCEKEPPIPQEKFIKVYVDLLIIQDTTTTDNYSIDSVKAMVFQRHNISSGQYDEMLNYYNSQPEKWILFFDSATAYVEELKKTGEKQP